MEFNPFGELIYTICQTRPGWWYTFRSIIKHPKYTHFANTTMIISVYELKDSNLIILYEVLKEFVRVRAAQKVIHKKEFVIVHLASESIKEMIVNDLLWMSYNLGKTLSSRGYICETRNKKLVIIDGDREIIVDNSTEIQSINQLSLVYHYTKTTSKARPNELVYIHNQGSLFMNFQKSLLNIPLNGHIS